jgi:hypothetical protein
MKIKEYFVEASSGDVLLAKATTKAEELWKSEERFNQHAWVYIKHQDGSKFRLYGAFIKFGKIDFGKGKHKSEVIITIPEHTPVSYYHLDDLKYVKIKKEFNDKKQTVVEMKYDNMSMPSTYKIYKYE